MQVQCHKELGVFKRECDTADSLSQVEKRAYAYTWSKSIDTSSGFYDQINPYNPGSSRALSTFDLTHNFVISYSYDLPFTKSASGVQGKVLSGWTITGITRFTTGFPITISESNDDHSLCGCTGADVPESVL